MTNPLQSNTFLWQNSIGVGDFFIFFLENTKLMYKMIIFVARISVIYT